MLIKYKKITIDGTTYYVFEGKTISPPHSDEIKRTIFESLKNKAQKDIYISSSFIFTEHLQNNTPFLLTFVDGENMNDYLKYRIMNQYVNNNIHLNIGELTKEDFEKAKQLASVLTIKYSKAELYAICDKIKSASAFKPTKKERYIIDSFNDYQLIVETVDGDFSLYKFTILGDGLFYELGKNE